MLVFTQELIQAHRDERVRRAARARLIKQAKRAKAEAGR